MDAYAGLDVGTSSCKLLVYDLDGNVLYQTACYYQESGTSGFRELDPEIVKAGVYSVLEKVGKECSVPIAALAVASLGESVVCLDRDDISLAPSMLTGDSRGIPETDELIERIGSQAIFEMTGLPPNELYSLPKWMWLNRNSDVINRSDKIFFYEDYVGYLLTGKRCVSYTSASRSMAFDIRRNDWSSELLSLAGIKVAQMSKPVRSGTMIGTILPESASRFHLNPAMKVVAGGHDQSCAALGSGVLDKETAECSMGTCEFMLLPLPTILATLYMIENNFTCIPYVLPDIYLTSLEVTTCGILKNWAKNLFFQSAEAAYQAKGKNFFSDYIDPKIKGMRTNVLALPQFGSAGNPDLSMDAWGTITGLTIHTQPEEIFCALIEGVSFQLYLAYQRLKMLDIGIKRIVCTGGGAVSDVTLNIRANIFNMDVQRLESKEAGTLGCMLLAATGSNAYASLEEGIRRAVRIQQTFHPDGADAAWYREKFKKYQDLYDRMHDFH